MEKIIFSGNTHPGTRRSANQDACIMQHLRPGDKVLAAVIDGVGGYAGGERAAAIAKDCIEQYMQTPSGDTLTMLREALIFANNQITTERKKDQRFGEMCCVLTAIVADALAQQIYFVHVGDTRLYRYRDSKLQKLTRDHSFVGIREDAGEISEAEAMAHPHRNQILREVGSAIHRLDDEDFMDYDRDTYLPGDLLLLCSDGLTDMITAQQLLRELSASYSLNDKTENLIKLANECGGHDNITVVLLQCTTEVLTQKNTNYTIPAAIKTTDPLPSQTSNKKNKQSQKNILLPVFLFLILMAGAGWYFVKPDKNTAPIVMAHPVATPRSDSVHQSIHPAMPLREENDTLRLSSTQNFTDLKKFTDSSGKMLVLVPQKNNNKHFPAVSITVRSANEGDTILVKNIRFAGFETGIDIQLPVVLKAENLVFENTTTPFRYPSKPNEKKASVLFINTAKQ